jgi:hypothetical protein
LKVVWTTATAIPAHMVQKGSGLTDQESIDDTMNADNSPIHSRISVAAYPVSAVIVAIGGAVEFPTRADLHDTPAYRRRE